MTNYCYYDHNRHGAPLSPELRPYYTDCKDHHSRKGILHKIYKIYENRSTKVYKIYENRSITIWKIVL